MLRKLKKQQNSRLGWFDITLVLYVSDRMKAGNKRQNIQKSSGVSRFIAVF
jgi:hypothetical protein